MQVSITITADSAIEQETVAMLNLMLQPVAQALVDAIAPTINTLREEISHLNAVAERAVDDARSNNDLRIQAERDLEAAIHDRDNARAEVARREAETYEVMKECEATVERIRSDAETKVQAAEVALTEYRAKYSDLQIQNTQLKDRLANVQGFLLDAMNYAKLP